VREQPQHRARFGLVGDVGSRTSTCTSIRTDTGTSTGACTCIRTSTCTGTGTGTGASPSTGTSVVGSTGIKRLPRAFKGMRDPVVTPQAFHGKVIEDALSPAVHGRHFVRLGTQAVQRVKHGSDKVGGGDVAADGDLQLARHDDKQQTELSVTSSVHHDDAAVDRLGIRQQSQQLEHSRRQPRDLCRGGVRA
jgi:hypothetical protein